VTGLVALDVAKQHLRVEHAHDDADITLKIDQASAIVTNYIKRTAGDDDVDWTSDSVPPDIQAATLIMLSRLYDDRDAGREDGDIALGYLPKAITAILHRWRDPALA
jgi:hypothetical protein